MSLRPFLHSWLRSAAAEKIREKAVHAARRHAQETTEQVQAAAGKHEPCHCGVVFALRIESGGLEDLLKQTTLIKAAGFTICQGKLKDRRVALAISGAGRKQTAKATDALLSGHRPSWVISAGFAGGLSPQLKRHDVLVADRLADVWGHHLAIDLPGDPAALAEAPGVHVGRLLTADRIVRLPKEKRSLGREHDAVAVDMETFAVAEVCRDRGVPFLSVRVINDAVDDALPKDVEKLLMQKTTAARLGAAAGAIWRRPGSIKDMYALRENALVASDRLAEFLAGMIDGLGGD